MINIYIIIFVIHLLCSTLFASIDKNRSDELLLFSEIKTHQYIIAEHENNFKKEVIIYSYLKNNSNGLIKLSIPREPLVSNKILGYIYYSFFLGVTSNQLTTKPTICDINIIELLPGEIAALPIVRIEYVNDEAVPNTYTLSYNIDSRVKKYYDVWIGKKEITQNLPVD